MKNDVSRFLRAACKHARRQLERERRTRFGLAYSGRRAVASEIPADIAVEAPCDEQLIEQEERAMAATELTRRLRIVEGQMREFTQDPVTLALIKRRLRGGESIESLAKELGIKPGTARCRVHRAKGFLTEREP